MYSHPIDISSLNRRVKQLEQHLEIKICVQGETVETVFERFTSYTEREAEFILCSRDKAKRYKMTYSFVTRELHEEKTGAEVEVADLFSNRYLRSILFVGKEVLTQQSMEENSFSKFFHDHCKKKKLVPILCVNHGLGSNQIRWMYISSIKVTIRNIEIDGLLSIVGKDYFHQPLVAKCKIDYNKENYTWKYALDGEKRNETFEGSLYKHDVTISGILFLYMEYLMLNEDVDLIFSDYPELTMQCREIFKNARINLTSEKTDPMGLWVLYRFLFHNIKEITDEEIVFEGCDGDSLDAELIYNRKTGVINAYYKPSANSPKRCKMAFKFHDNDAQNGEKKFRKVIRLIERIVMKK